MAAEPPPAADFDQLREAARGCRACPLWEPATQTVFGEGPATASLVLLGEQPGDKEDRAGRPFVGPAGRVLDDALAAAGIDRSAVYTTNAVKHFKHKPAGKVRLHQNPAAREVAACRPWLDAELALVDPEVVVLLGATAGKAILGSAFRVTRDRGRVLDWPGPARLIATIHPSAVLRAPDAEGRAAALDGLVADLRVAAGVLSPRET
jgi:DNA polymerase